MLQDFDLNVALDEVEYGDICSPEVKKEIILQSSLTSSRSSSDPKKGPEFARALAKKAGVYNKVKGLSVPEPRLNRLDKIAPNLQQ
ncbi:hypothetical protein WN943_021175 [Citrus x changshan-huyou]